MVAPVSIAGRLVGPGVPCLIIAEAGVNHDGLVELGHDLVDMATDAGVDAIKFQTFRADRLASASAGKTSSQQRSTHPGESQRQMLHRLELSADAHRELLSHCGRRGVLFLSSPFDDQSVDLLEQLGVPAFKIPSGEITNLPLLRKIARIGRPLLLSTGMATLDEVRDAVETVVETGNEQLVLLHCVSSYPADPADANLRAMEVMSRAFSRPVGYSDHTLGIDVSIAAVALGAVVLEKHVTMDCRRSGPDHAASLDPSGLGALVRGIRRVEAALGHGRKEPAASEAETARVARKSLVAACSIEAGTVVSEAHVALKRPGTGLSASMLDRVIGRSARQDIAADTLLTLDMLR